MCETIWKFQKKIINNCFVNWRFGKWVHQQNIYFIKEGYENDHTYFLLLAIL